MTIFRQLLFLHWKGVRFGLLPLALGAFGLPLLAVQGVLPGGEIERTSTVQAAYLFHSLQLWLPLFPLLATLTGATLALSAWNWDHRGDHVYALSLPLRRWEYVLMKMGAGILLLLIPFLAFWLGGVLATSSLEIPEGLRAYPTAVALRFLLASLVIFAILFAMGAGTLRTAVWVLVTILAVAVLGSSVPEFLRGTLFPGMPPFDLLEWVLQAALGWPGPFEVMTGSWMLVDV